MGSFVFTTDGGATATTSGSITLGTASQPTETFNNSDQIRKLNLEIDSLKNELTLQKNENLHLSRQINDLQIKINLDNGLSIDKFSDKELKIILSKIHPDKNDGKQSFNDLTKKINNWRSK